MPLYHMTISATSNTVVNTEDTFLDIVFPATNRGILKRCHFSLETAAQDTRSIIRILRKSAQGATGVAGVAVKVDPNTRASGVTLTTAVKNGVTAMAAGTITDILDVVNLNGRAIYEWIPKNATEEEYFNGGTIAGINLMCSAVSIIHRVTAWWED